MSDIYEQIELIEKEIRETPYHKGTEHHIGRLRARLAKLKDKVIEGSKGGGGGGGFAVKKEGDATVVLVGPPSAGKSTLINKFTNAQSKVAPYAFTTVSVIPGMMDYKDAKIQILDVPGLIEGAKEGKGRGKEVLSVVRGADLLIIMSDIERESLIKMIVNELTKAGIRINQDKPKVNISKRVEGGLIVHSNIRQIISEGTIKEIAREFGINNAEITINEKIDFDRLIDSFSPNRVYVPAVFVLNKADGPLATIKDILYVSALNGRGLDELKEIIWEKLGLVRIYLVKPGFERSKDNAFIARRNQTLKEVAFLLGEHFQGVTFAKIWGESARFPGQEVSLETVVQEGTQVQFV